MLNILRNLGGGAFLLLCSQIFRDGKAVPGWLLGLFVLQLLVEEPVEWLIGPAWALAHPVASTWLYEVLPGSIQILFMGISAWWMLDQRQADLVEPRRRVRMLLIAVWVVQIAASILLERIVMGLELMPYSAMYPTHVTLVGISLVLLVFIHLSLDRVDPAPFLIPDLAQKSQLRSSHSPSTPAAPDTTTADVARITQALTVDSVYRQPGLTVADLAKHLSIPEYRLRALIHDHMDYRNFNALLHDHRIAEVAANLADPSQNATPVLTLALSAGYQSLTPFNRAFREAKAMTPTQFRQSSQSISTKAD